MLTYVKLHKKTKRKPNYMKEIYTKMSHTPAYTADKHPIKIFGWSLVIAAAAVVAGYFYGGVGAALLVLLLVVFETSLSFDNAIINARIVEKLSDFWRKIFLTVGILVAVVLMRLLFPLVIVGVATGLNPLEAWNLAMEKGSIEDPGTYAYILHAAHPQIAAFGGMFLLMLFLDWIFSSERDIHWLRWIEIPLAKIGKLDVAAIIVGLLALLAISALAGEHATVVLSAGVVGMILYLAINALGNFFENKLEEDEEKAEKNNNISAAARLTGKAAFASFIYLEVLDASFSLDGVIGGLSLSTDPIILALGLGAGALFVRSMTIFLVNKGTLNEFRFLDHGAHWAIGALAVLLIVSIATPVPEIVTGLIGVALIIASFITSVVHNKRDAKTALFADNVDGADTVDSVVV